MSAITAWAAQRASGPLAPFEYDPGPLPPDMVEIAVEHCGICHSDLSMLDNEWGMTAYPFVPGHEAIGRIVATGEDARGHAVGQRVGLGWTASSCMHCRQCLGGDHHLCPSARGTIVGRHGAFANRVRAHWAWVVALPEALDASASGPLLCGGVTVFAPLIAFGVQPTDRVGVIGIGGLGHMALMFARAWGCEVTAFTSSPSKHDEARELGAHHVVSTHDTEAMKALAGKLDFIIDTVNAPLEWDAVINTLAPRGRLHIVGAVLEPIPVSAMLLMSGQRSVSSSPTGSPLHLQRMLDFAARHQLRPVVEDFPLSAANEAMARLASGKARYRVVLHV